MGLNGRNRVSSVDILQFDYEYCSISFYGQSGRNDLGEPNRVLTLRSTNVRCSIDPLNRVPAYVSQDGLRDVLRQGIIEHSLFIMTLSSEQIIEPGDIVTDYDGVYYDVLHVLNWYSHKEAFIRKVN